MYSFGSKVLGAAAPKPPLIHFGYALISVLMRLTFTFGATFRHEEMLKACSLKCKLADKFTILKSLIVYYLCVLFAALLQGCVVSH